jgi:hypothetical protein
MSANRRLQKLRAQRKIAAWILLGCAVTAMIPKRAAACGPFFVEPQYVFRRRPGGPYPAYASGDLGLVQRSFMTVFLIVAYRGLAGARLDREEREGFLGILPLILGGRPGDREKSEAIDRWNSAASRLEVAPIQWREGGDALENVSADAFVVARSALERISAENPDWVRAWANRQREVLTCSVLEAPPRGAPLNLQRDLAYQDAAHLFYGGNFSQAEEAFRAIAADTDSPWRALASYLVARSLIHESHALGSRHPAEYSEDWIGYQPEQLRQAEAKLRAVLADRAAASVRGAAWKALSLVETQLDPERWHGELLQHLEHRGTGSGFGELAHDAQIYPQWGDPDRERPPMQPPRSDLEAWLRVFREDRLPAGEAKAIALEKWREKRTLPWLIALLSVTPEAEPLEAEMLDAALVVPESSPAWHTVSYALVKRWLHDGKIAEARARLHSVLEARERARPSTRNAFAQLRAQIPETYQEAFDDGMLTPAGFDDEGDNLLTEARGKERSRRLSDEEGTTRLAATIPAQKLIELARAGSLSRLAKRQVLLSAWSRAVIADELPIARDAAAALIGVEPAIAKELRRWLEEPPDSQRFVAVALMARLPGISPYLEPEWERAQQLNLAHLEYSFETNWWCQRTLAEEHVYPRGPATARAKVASIAPASASAEEAAANEREWSALQAAGNAPDIIAREVLAWSESHPRDSRTAEALHDAVRATRFGCGDGDTHALSTKAFRALHKLFPDSEWTRKTPYSY